LLAIDVEVYRDGVLGVEAVNWLIINPRVNPISKHTAGRRRAFAVDEGVAAAFVQCDTGDRRLGFRGG
jgi:hypothetical protein